MSARRLRLPLLLTTAATAVLTAALGAGPASADIPWAACPTAGYQCATVPVPLDHSGVVPGTVDLSVQRVPAANNPNNVAVVALAGGPGQAALPLAQDTATVLQPAIADRDLLLFDQRGTGSSGALDCKALSSNLTVTKAVTRCARELGPTRGFYTTADSVADIEALRVAGGYSKLVLFGISYGTKVAEAYAAAYPDNVESLVLDSVVLPEGPDPFERSTFTAAPRVLRELCADKECAGATDNVTRDLSRMAAKLRKGRLRGKVVLSSGRRASVSMFQSDLVSVLLAGDLNPTLRAELPGSLRAALRGDNSPLLRLYVRSVGLTTGLQSDATDQENTTLYVTTTCEEEPFAWTRAAGVDQRRQEIEKAALAVPKAQLGPFSITAALDGPIQLCLGWPNASPAPVAPPPLPAVRTLVLGGQMDLRTPYEDAAQLAQRIPGATIIEVPDTGHSTVGTDASTGSACTKGVLATFFAGGTPGACPAIDNPYSPTRRPPTSFSKITGPSRSARTVKAAAATVTDAARQIIGDALALDALPRHVGGLRAGNATVNKGGGFTLNRYQYVPGVVVSGTVGASYTARLTIHGGGALSGRLTITASGSAHGTLGGKKVTIAASSSLRRSLPTVASVLKRPRLLVR